MRRVAILIPWFVLAAAVVVYLTVLPLATVKRQQHKQLFTLPPKVLRVMSFQFREAAGDVALLNAMVFLGGTRTQSSTHRYLPEQYEWVHNTLKNAVVLDPYFLDPYYLMNSALIWDRYKLAEVNDLIAKGADTRNWDHVLAYFAGFNYYYFLDNRDKSFHYLTEASKRSGGNPFYDGLASLVAYKANKTELAIAYLEEQIGQAEQEGRGSAVESLKARLDALKGIRQIEVAVESYRKLFNRLPASVAELKTVGLLADMPVAPFGGKYLIDSEGRLHSNKDLK